MGKEKEKKVLDKELSDTEEKENIDIKQEKEELEKTDKTEEVKNVQNKLKKQRKGKELKDQKEKEKRQRGIDLLNKKHNLSLVSFDDYSLSDIKWVDIGISEFNKMLSGCGINGWPRGRMIELYGSEGSGKTFILTKTYAKCLSERMKCLHFDAEGTYHKDFAQMHGVDISKLDISSKDGCEEVMEDIEKLLIDDVYDIIGVDSLAALIPKRTYEGDMGKENFGNQAAAISRCYPRVNSALKKSKTVLIFVNQLRDDISAAGKRWMEPEKTPGGRTIKFYASIRVDVRRTYPDKKLRPDMFENGNKIGHILKCKVTKNKVFEPFKYCQCDLMYKKPSRAVSLIKKAIENDIIKRQRAEASGNLYGKTLIYRNKSVTPEEKYDPYYTHFWLKENNLLVYLLSDMGVDDFDEFIESGDITQKHVEEFLIENC